MNWNIKEIQEAASKSGLSNDLLNKLIEKLPNKRTGKENKCIHMYFTLAAYELNNIGHTFNYQGLKGNIIETEWTAELFKNTVWKSLQNALTDKKSTTDLTNSDIQMIYRALNKWFSEKGIYIPYPSREDQDFSEYMNIVNKKYQNFKG